MTRFGPFFRIFAVAFAVMLAMTSVVAVSAQENNNQQDENQNQNQEQQVQLDELLQNTDQYVDNDVTVSGQVGEAIEREAFTLTTGGQDGEQILVVGDRMTMPRTLPDNVQVSGTVEQDFNISDVEDQLSIRLSNEDLQQFEGQPYIHAMDVTSGEQDQPRGQQDDQAEQVTLSELYRNMDEFQEQRVQVNGELQNTPLPYTYVLVSGDDQIAVLADPNMAPQNLPTSATVTGMVHVVTVADLVRAVDIAIPQEFRSLLEQFGPVMMIGAEQISTDDQAGQPQPIDDLLQNPEQYTGQDVTVNAQVGEELEREAFTIARNGEEILVIGDQQAIPSNLPDRVQVQGSVQSSFDALNAEDQLGIQLNENQLSQYEGQPYIVADAVDEADQENRVTPEGESDWFVPGSIDDADNQTEASPKNEDVYDDPDSNPNQDDQDDQDQSEDQDSEDDQN